MQASSSESTLTCLHVGVRGHALLPKAMGHHTKFDTSCSGMRKATYCWHAGCENRTIFKQGATQDCVYRSLQENTFSLDGE
jgi:hypothetical protein